MKITWNNHEIRNPILRLGAALVVFFMCIVVLPAMVIVSLPIHLLLLLCGRRGFTKTGDDGRLNYSIDSDGFRRR